MSNIFQQIIDSIKQVAKDSGQFHPLFVEGESNKIGTDAYYAQINDEHDESIRLATEALALYPKNMQVRINRARAYITIRDYDSALADVDYLLQIDPNHRNALLMRGEIYTNMEKFQSAIGILTHVIDSHAQSDNLSAYRYRAFCAYHVDSILAIHDYTYLIHIKQSNEELKKAYVNRGSSYLKLKIYDLAYLDYQSAVEIDPQYHLAYSGYVNVYSRQKQFDKALKFADKCLELDPKNVGYIRARAWLYGVLGQHKKAIAEYEQALKLDQDTYHIYNDLAFIYPHIDKLDKALHYATQAIEISNPTASIFDTRAQVYWLKGNYDKALADFETAIDLDKQGLYFAGQAVTVDAMGDTAKAIELWHEAITLDDTLADPAVFADEYHYALKYVEAIHTLADKAKS